MNNTAVNTEHRKFRSGYPLSGFDCRFIADVHTSGNIAPVNQDGSANFPVRTKIGGVEKLLAARYTITIFDLTNRKKDIFFNHLEEERILYQFSIYQVNP